MHLNFFFLLGFWVQSVTVSVAGASYYGNDAFISVPIAAIILTPIGHVVGLWSARRESHSWQTIAISSLLTNLGLAALQVGVMWRKPDVYWLVRRRMTAYAAIAIPLLLSTIAMAVICMRNFDKGLEPHIRRNRVPNADEIGNLNQRGQESGSGQYLEHPRCRMLLE